MTIARSFWMAFGLAGLTLLAGCGAGNNETPASFDPTELALVRVEPSDGESSVPRNRIVRLIFNTTVLPKSVTDQSVQVRTGGTFQTRPEGSFLITGNVIEFDPTVTQTGGANNIGFPAGAQILLDVPLKVPGDGEPDVNFVQNVEENPITIASGDNIVTFITGSGWIDPVPGPPGALSLEFTPGPNAAGQVPAGAAVTIIFAEPMDPGTVLLSQNIYLTNNTDTAPIFQQDIPSITFVDGSLTRFTFLPVFGFGKGPFNVKVNFIDPDDPSSFDPALLPTDLGGNRVQNFTFLRTFDTQFSPEDVNTGLVREEFLSQAQMDMNNTDAIWATDSSITFALVGQPITTRSVNLDILNFAANSQATTAIDNPPLAGSGVPPAPHPGNEDFCPTVNPLVGPDLTVGIGNPPTSQGRRQQNLYRQAEVGASGTIVRTAWGPDSDATFAATYGGVTIYLGHHKAKTSLAPGSFFSMFDVNGHVKVVNKASYAVPQAFDISGGGTRYDGYLDWPKLDTFFEFNGMDDVIIDVAAQEGNTWQQFRTYLSLSPAFAGAFCACTNFPGCNPNNSVGLRQMDTTYLGDSPNPSPIPLTVANPAPFVHVMQFELAKLRSDAQSLYYDTLDDEPDYLTPIIAPLVQPGGAIVLFTWSASADGVTEDVPFTPNLNACDGFRHVRFHVVLRSNIFTGFRGRVSLLEIPFTFD